MSTERMARVPVTSDSTVSATKDHISSEVAGETVVLDLKGGVYFGLDPIGSRIWSLLQQPISVGAIRDALTAEYDVDAQQCEQDVLALLVAMAARGLITIHS